MNKKLKYSIIFFIYISLVSVIIPKITYAQEGDSGIGYTYKIIKPENQIGNAGYFDLRMIPDQNQIVEIELYNMTEQEMVVDVAVNSAKTNSNGVIEYGPTKLEKDPSLKYDIKDIVKVQEKVTLEPKGTQKVPVKITMPSEKYDGTISGGIYLQKASTDAEKKADEATKGVVNKYAFIVGMLLTESDTKVQPELMFNKIYAGLSNYRNTFLVNFSNTEATYVEGMTVDAQIFKKGSDEVLYESKKENYRMAPNSSMTFPISLNGEAFVAGDYEGHIVVTAGDKKWEWKEAFTVTQKEVDKYNAEDVSLIQDRGINWEMIALIVGSLLFLLLSIYLVVRWVSKRRNENNRKRKKRIR